jgi:hypothetical protein
MKHAVPKGRSRLGSVAGGVAVLVLVAGAVGWRIDQVNSAWPEPHAEVAPPGQALTIGDRAVAVRGARLLDGPEALELAPNLTLGMMAEDGGPLPVEDVKLMLVSVSGVGAEAVTGDDLSLQSGAWSTGADREATPLADAVGAAALGLETAGEPCTVLAYRLYASAFSKDRWDRVRELPFELVRVHYPTQYVLRLPATV